MITILKATAYDEKHHKKMLEELHKVYRGDIEFAVSDLTKALISLEVRGLITTYQTGKERIIELIPQQKRRRVVPPGED